ncbi:MAG TPA: hypothetical protein VHO69_05415, partial [Phototrophicaceae bacterium]|nr:hypothetical protein [Phototrophicaceae bacterium]
MSDPNSRETKSDTRPIPPIPPEMPDEAPTRSQQPLDRTRAMAAVNPPPSRTPPPPPPAPMAYTGDKAKRGQRPAPPRKADSGFYLPLWSIGLMLVGVAMTVGCFVLLVLSLGGRQTPVASAPRFVIITAPPTLPGQETLPVLLVSPTLPEGFGPGFQGTVPAFALQGPTLPPVILTPTPIALG